MIKDFKAGVKIIYFPYTKGISSTKINAALDTLQPKHKDEK